MESRTVKNIMKLVMDNDDIYSVGIDGAGGYEEIDRDDMNGFKIIDNRLLVDTEDGMLEFDINMIFTIELM